MKLGRGLAFVLAAVFSIVAFAFGTSVQAQRAFRASLDGAQEVPPNASAATGFGSVVLNAAETAVSIRLTFSGLGSNQTAAHIHSPAMRGATAGVIIDLGSGGSTSSTYALNNVAVTAQQAADLKAGLWYFNVHSVNFPNGEIRGQIEPACEPAPAGLVSWYPAEGNALDIRSRNTGTLVNGVAFAAGKVGQTFSFDGLNDRVTTNLDVQPSAMPSTTWDAWVFPTRVNYTFRQSILSNDDGGFDRTVLIEANTSNFAVFTGTGVWQPTSVTPNQWQHIAVVYTPTNIFFYKNGVQFSLGAPPSGQATANRFTIGANPVGGFTEHFQGLVDEVEVFNRPLSAAEITAIYNADLTGKCTPTATIAPPGQVAWLAGDGNANDISGSGNNGTLQNGAGFAVGRVGQGFNFDGINDYVSMPRAIQNDFTVEFWVRTMQTGGGEGQWYEGFGLVDGEVGGVTNDFGVSLGNGRILFGTGAPDVTIRSGMVNDGAWHHVAATRVQGTGTLTLYVDGAQVATATAGTQGLTAPPAINIGRLQTAINYFNGQLDEVSLYSRALTPGEIQSIFGAGIAGKLKATVTPIGLADFGLGISDWGFEKPASPETIQNPQVVTVIVGDATVTFPSVTAAGTTHEIPLSLSDLPPLPLNATSTGLTYDIGTSATYSGSPTVCFNLPSFMPMAFAGLRILHLEGGVWTNRTDLASTYPNLCTTGLPSLSPFAIVNLAPTAANVSVSGRVKDAAGVVIPRAIVSLTDSNGETSRAVTNSFGYFRFEAVPVGQTYVVTVGHKRYRFTPQVVTVEDEITDLDFVALE
jgi:hypothetical protein